MNETAILDVLESVESNVHSLTIIAIAILMISAAAFTYIVAQYYKK